jgi:hypothetical protein
VQALAFIHAYWTARRRRVAAWSKKLLLLVLPPLLAVPASAAVVLAAFARFQKLCKHPLICLADASGSFFLDKEMHQEAGYMNLCRGSFSKAY